MTRREFAQLLAALGVVSALPACASDELLHWDIDVQFTGKVVIVGAGAAGLASGYLLDRYGIEFEIVEAAPGIGGRVRRHKGLAEFPIDLGAEWIHQDPSILADLVDDPDAAGEIDVVRYAPETVANARDGQLIRMNAGSALYAEHKFRRSTWFGFLDEHIAEPIRDRIHVGRPIARIEHGSDGVVLVDADGQELHADRVILTVPIKVLQAGGIVFEPALPASKTDAIDAVFVPDGLKVFLRFDARFYPDITLVGPLLGDTAQEKILYDAAFGKDSPDHVLAIFWVGEGASAWAALADDAIVDAALSELSELFDHSATLIDAVVQNWSAEPYVLGAYSTGFEGDEEAVVSALNAPVDQTLYFAGEALSADNGATVPGAMESAYATVRLLLETAG